MMPLEELEALLKVLQTYAVRACTLGDMTFELGPAPQKLDASFLEETKTTAAERKRDLEELLYASSGG